MLWINGILPKNNWNVPEDLVGGKQPQNNQNVSKQFCDVTTKSKLCQFTPKNSHCWIDCIALNEKI